LSLPGGSDYGRAIEWEDLMRKAWFGAALIALWIGAAHAQQMPLQEVHSVLANLQREKGRQVYVIGTLLCGSQGLTCFLHDDADWTGPTLMVDPGNFKNANWLVAASCASGNMCMVKMVGSLPDTGGHVLYDIQLVQPPGGRPTN
jgi:hypothetical protein